MQKKLLVLFSLIYSLAAYCQSNCKNCYAGSIIIDSTNKANIAPHNLNPNGSGTLGQNYDLENVCGLNFTTVSQVTETRTKPLAFNTNGSGFPSALTVSNMPCGGADSVIEAFAYWMAEYTEPLAPNCSIVITNPNSSVASYPATNIGTGASTCWATTGTANYRADITASISGNGNYGINLTGFNNPGYEVDGVSFIIIYKNPSATYSGSISIWDGCIVCTTGNPLGPNTYSGFTACDSTTNTSVFDILGDCQNNISPFSVKDDLNGGVATFGQGFWQLDMINGTALTNGQTSISATTYTNNTNDCYGWEVTGLYWQNTTCESCIPATSSVTVTTSQLNPSCGGGCNGSIGISVSGGVPPYTYTWNPNVSTTDTATGLCGGTYSCTIQDANCPPADTVIVFTLPSNTLALTPTIISNELCYGNCVGSASVVAAGGHSPYTYLWTPVGETTSMATGLCVGTYSISVTDINGCTGTATISITQPTAVAASIAAPVNPVCFGGTGTATAQATGGISRYRYLWANAGGTNAMGTGLRAGNYTVTVTDSNGCTATAATTLTQPSQVTAAISGTTNVLCNGGTGTATATAGGGTSPYAYSWTNPGGTGATGTGLTAGSYTVTVTDFNGCTASTRATITQPTILYDSITSDLHSYCDLANGKASITGKGGVGPYTYSWTPTNQTTALATGLSAGTYSIVVTDKNHCSTSATVNITQPSAVTAIITATKGVGCYNGGNGSATVTAGGGTSPYTYLWNPGGNTSSTATGLFALGYTVTVTDANGCTETASTTITEPTQLMVAIAEPAIICKDSTGILLANASGGTAPYKYAWSGGITSTTGTATVTPTATRYFTVTVTDMNGCTASGQITLEYGPSFAVAITGKNSVCVGDSTTICASASGGMGKTSYEWEPGNSTNACIPVHPGIASVFTITVIDGCGATTTASTTVYTVPSPTINMYANIYEGCAPLCIQFHNGTTITQGGIRQYVWNFGNGDTSFASNPEYCYSSGGEYNVTLTAISDSGCAATYRKLSMINIYTRPEAAFTYSPQPVSILSPTVQFTDLSTDAYGLAYRWWNFGDGSDSTGTSAISSHTYADTGSYCVTLIEMNDRGCSDTATNCLVIEPQYDLYIPSAFSPNGDGLNDVFEAKGKYIKSFEMYIFDRWGMQLYHATDINKGWNGSANGGSGIVQEDTYIYKITVTDAQDNQHSYLGDVTLIK